MVGIDAVACPGRCGQRPMKSGGFYELYTVFRAGNELAILIAAVNKEK